MNIVTTTGGLGKEKAPAVVWLDHFCASTGKELAAVLLPFLEKPPAASGAEQLDTQV